MHSPTVIYVRFRDIMCHTNLIIPAMHLRFHGFGMALVTSLPANAVEIIDSQRFRFRPGRFLLTCLLVVSSNWFILPFCQDLM